MKRISMEHYVKLSKNNSPKIREIFNRTDEVKRRYRKYRIMSAHNSQVTTPSLNISNIDSFSNNLPTTNDETK